MPEPIQLHNITLLHCKYMCGCALLSFDPRPDTGRDGGIPSIGLHWRKTRVDYIIRKVIFRLKGIFYWASCHPSWSHRPKSGCSENGKDERASNPLRSKTVVPVI